MRNFFDKLMDKDAWAYGLFWSWNLIFLAFMTLGFAPRILPEMILAVGTAAIPASFLLYALILTAIPLGTLVLGLTIFRRMPARLFALGYVVEGPLMLMLAIRFFIIREATPALNLILAIAGLGIAAFLWYLLDRDQKTPFPLFGWTRLVGLTLMVLVSLYVAVWIGFYALPLAAVAAQWLGNTFADLPGFFRNIRYALTGLTLIWVPFTVLGFILLLYTATLFILTPIVVPLLSLRAWRRDLADLGTHHGRNRPASLVFLTVTVCMFLVIAMNQQPQQKAFALLESRPESLEAARGLLAQQEQIRAGLLNAYLAPFRYISATGEVVHVRQLYQNVFGMPEASAARVQQLYESVARPLLYDPVHEPEQPFRRDNVAFRSEPAEAADLYQRFFDQTIVDGERQTIVSAVRATWSIEQAEAAWQAVDDREILMAHQEVSIAEHGDWAEVELHEVYQNQTFERQEVIYYFNLPESAVLTGVWLGNSPERAERFPFQVAPRGAAQAVYRNETRTFRDPALLEQIGPRQYRLRVFPVLPVQSTWDEDRAHTLLQEAPPLYMWMTYQVMAVDSAWPLPDLAYKRNVYWNGESTRLINGVEMQVMEDTWLPTSVPANAPIEPTAHRMDLAGGMSVVAVPATQAAIPPLPANLRLAVVLDRSGSMAEHAEEVAAAWAQLAQVAETGSTVEVYLSASSFRGEAPSRTVLSGIDPQEILYFGGQNAAELLMQFENLRAGDLYDAVLVFTDGSGYELGESELAVPIPPAPVWMVHLGSDIPLGYDDDTLEAIQASGGGVVGELDQALRRLAVALEAGRGTAGSVPESRDLMDGYLWTVLPTDQAAGTSSEEGFAPFAARRLILAEIEAQRGALDQLGTLDDLHAVAQEYQIVSPYSSMIVLVTADQQRILDHLLEQSGRFEREFEDLTDTTPSTPMALTGVPEPHEWLLLGLGLAMLLWYVSKRRPELIGRLVG